MLTAVLLVLITGCSMDANPYQAYEPYCIFEPYTTPGGAHTFYASVTLIRADTEIPSQCYIDGELYDVAVFNGFSNKSDAGKLYSIELPSFITVISSHAFEMAEKVKTVTLPENITSLGQTCLPKNMQTLTVSAEAICSTKTASLWNALSTPETLKSLTITGTAQSTVSLKEFGENESSLENITLKGYGARWPQMPYVTKEGMKFLGWYTKDPTVYEDAEKAEAGKLVANYSMTVYPYWVEGEETGDEEDQEPLPMEPVSFYKVYSFGINRDYIHLDYDSDTDEYTVSLDTTHWFWEWTYNGKPVEMENSSSFTFSRSDGSGTQVMCFQCDSEGNPSGGALMIEL